MRFHLDEHIHTGVAVGLRAQGIDVTTTSDAKLVSSADAAQVTFANSQGRVIVTHDHDFLRLHSLGVSHAGIAYCHQDKYSTGQLIRLLTVLHICYSAEEMIGRVEYL